jgi:riboflavin kinase/FMN adenylyltransferase
VWIADSFDLIKTPTSVALGNFDGVHRGHRHVIQPILGLNRSTVETVVTFHPHPQEFFTKQRRALLTPITEKAYYLSKLGIQQLVLLPFTQDLANLSPQAFVEEILVQRLQAQQISVGQDFCFGRQRSGTTDDLQRIAAQYDIPVQVASLHTCQGERISSSAIRHALEAGNLERANQLLGRSYTLLGNVIQGQQLGRTIGFPTANLQLPPEKFLPCQGVYSVWVDFLSSDFELAPQPPQPGVMNLGNRPTVNGIELSVEVHLLDWSGNLYGENLMVRLEGFLRPEQKFASLDELKAQIQADCEVARSRLSVSQFLAN